jgi:hypothetical protein
MRYVGIATTVQQRITCEEAKGFSRLIGHACDAGPASRRSMWWFRAGIAGAALIVRLAIAGAALVLPLHSALAQFIAQGPKLVGSGFAGSPSQGNAVALSADGNTAIVGAPNDGSTGAAWVFTRSGGVWSQQGSKLVGTGAVGSNVAQGGAVALSSDGNTAIIGGFRDNASQGAAWVFTRSGGVWTQMGDKLVGSGANMAAGQGAAVALSGDGNTAIVGGPQDGGDNSGAAWVYTRSPSGWSQQGAKLTGDVNSLFGQSLALSADGNIALIGEPVFNSQAGTVAVFGRSGGVWTLQNGLVGSGAVGAAWQGRSVALSADGRTAIVGGVQDNGNLGAAWVFIRTGANSWFQQGTKLVGSGAIGAAQQGISVGLSADGNTAMVGGWDDNSFIGAAWAFTRSGTVWSQLGDKLVGAGNSGIALEGTWVALSGDGQTGIVGGPSDNSSVGAAWVFVRSRTATHDFNGDHMSDIAWRDTTGNVAIWEMNGTSILNASTSFVGNVPGNWSILGNGDYNGDGKSDILWHDTSGNVAIWEMNGTSILNASTSFVANVPGTWSIVGTGDFNGDGNSDILWRDGSGNVAIWEMNGTSVLNASTSFVANVPGNWSVVGNGDYNGDGKSDILWHDTSGNVAIWEMNGTTVLNASTSFVANVPGWTIVGTGDFDGDGKSDILWRDASGNVAIWEMNGTTVLNAATSFVANVGGTWSIFGSGDYNAAGKSDILWRDGSGNVVIWEMNGTAVLNQATSFVGNVAGNWSIQDPQRN